MARITIDDCLSIIPNRFDLTLAATVRARQIVRGATPRVDANGDKATVIALREMAAGKYGIEILVDRRTDIEGIPKGDTANEDAWRKITATAGETFKDDSVSPEPALFI